MPNHCSNNLTVTGADMQAFFDAVDAGDDNFIQTLVPMPKELTSFSTGGCVIDGERVSIWRDGPDGKPQKIPDIDLEHLKHLHGTTDWYAWAREHWGTKWGAYEQDVALGESECSIKFDSAWSPPIPAILTMSKIFPDAVFQLAFAEGGSCFYGYTIYQNGFLIDEFESNEFWRELGEGEESYDDGDIMDSLTVECREFLETHSLHTGG